MVVKVYCLYFLRYLQKYRIYFLAIYPWVHRIDTFFMTFQSPMLTFFRRAFCPENVHKNVKEFRLQLARELMGNYSSRCRAGRRPSQITTLPLHHFPIRIPDESHRRNFKRGRCAHCNASHRRQDTTWFCRECEVWLCHNGDLHARRLLWLFYTRLE